MSHTKKNFFAQFNFAALFVNANDADSSSVLRYSIVDGNTNDLFSIDRLSGEITVRAKGGLRLDNMPTDKVNFEICANRVKT
jgi:hypothetical protein